MSCLDGSKGGEEGGSPFPVTNQATGVGRVPRDSVLEILGGTLVLRWSTDLSAQPGAVPSGAEHCKTNFYSVSVWTSCLCPPNPYAESLTPKGMVLGGGAFIRLLGYGGEALLGPL